MRARGVCPLAVLAPAVAAVAAACDAPPLPLDTGVPWELAEHRSRTISGLAYRITLDVPAELSEPIRGRSLIGFVWDDPDRQPIVLDFLDPGARVDAVRINGADVPWEPVNDHVVIGTEHLEPGIVEIDIEYTAGDEAFNRSEEYLYALFVPDRAHFSLPVFDQPNLKAPVRWTVEAPAGWTVIANGPALDQMNVGGRATAEFLDTRPIPTYLFAVAAGLFREEVDVREDRVLRMYHRETDSAKVARNRDDIFDLHARALDWLEAYTGIAYPFQKFDFVLLPSFQYGGMEHPGGILYREAGLMLDETATRGQILGRASLIAHETAHMWFGDLVTMNWFDDVWTKEVFANFMAAKIVHPSFPDVDHDLRFLTAHHPSAYGVDRSAGANPIRQPLDNLREAGTLYGAIIYQKAPIVMRHLEARVGEEAFRDGLRTYLERFSYGNATWPDLIAILDERSEDDLPAWSRVWVEEPGRPTIAVSREGSDVVLTPSDPAGRGRVWPQRLGVRVGSPVGDSVIDIELGGEPVRIAGAGAALYVLPNGTGAEYGHFVLDGTSRAWLVDHVAQLPEGLVRGAAWVTLWDEVLEARLAPDAFLDAAVGALPGERDDLLVDLLLDYVGTLYWRLLPEGEREARAASLEALLWREARGERPATARAAFLRSLRSLTTTAEGTERLRRLWSGEEAVHGLPLSESDQIALATALALREVAGYEHILDTQTERIRNPDRRERFVFVRPALSANPVERAAFVASFADERNREQEPWVLEALDHVHHPLRRDHALGLIGPALELLPEIQRTGDIFFPGRWLDATLGGHASGEAAEIVRAYLAETPDLAPRLRQKVLQSADMLERAARIVHGWAPPS